ncbi:hypothetical protein MBLNU13_g09740t1 [Cladosporium sp. NU13]
MPYIATQQTQPAIGDLWHDKWNPPAIVEPSLHGLTVLVTGANTGVGFQAAIKLVKLGAANVIIAVRNLTKGNAAKERIEQATGKTGIVDVYELDMLDYSSIRAFSGKINCLDRLDVAILNAGIGAHTYAQSCYGWEKTLQVNTLSTTLLALLLLPKLRASKTAGHTPVLELVSSSMHFHIARMASDGDSGPLSIYNREEIFDMRITYNVSKLFLEYAHASLTRLATSSATDKPDVIVVSVCPGATKSDITRDITSLVTRATLIMFSLLQRRTEEGSRAYISGLILGEKGHGKFWSNDSIKEISPLLEGEEGFRLQETVWQEIITALRKDVSDIDQIIRA